MARVHLIEGPVGVGKTTYANLLGAKYKASPLILDDWMARLFRPDRPDTDFWDWYAVRKDRCIDQIWSVARGLLLYQDNVILELGLLQSRRRMGFYNGVNRAGFECRIHVLEASESERWRRIQRRNEMKGDTYAMHVSEEVFSLASRMWEAPDAEELETCDIKFVADSRAI